MPTYDLDMQVASVAMHCAFKHDFGCECWRRSSEVIAARKARIRSRLGHAVRRPLP